MGVTIGGKYLEHATAELQDRDIERTTTEVEHGNLHVLVGLVNTICQSCGSRLVDNTLHFETGNLSGFLGGLTLRVGEVGRYRDNGFLHLLAQIVLGGLLHLLQDHGRDFLRRIFTAFNLYAGIATFVHYGIGNAGNFLFGLLPVLTHETLDGINCVLRICDGLTLSGITHLTLAVLNKANHRRSGSLTFAVSDHYGLVALKNCDTTVSCTQVNTNNLSHNCIFLFVYISSL